MNALEVLPFILFIVVIVTSIAEKINVPYPLLLVAAGLCVGFMPGIPNWHPYAEMILPLFLPPILFAAARTITRQDILGHIKTIGSLSIVLVIATTVLLALLMDSLLPTLSFSTALVLGAIIAPTDTVAAAAIMSKMNVQQHIIRTIEVESLFNDATSIVLYKTAVFFVVAGSLSIGDITTTTIINGIGGIIIGLSLAYFTGLIVEQFLAESENDLPIIMSLILAYVAYLFADNLGVSGVLAVVTAGLYHRKTETVVAPRIRLSEKSVWDTLIFFLNGIIFITIGIQFPSYLKKVLYIPLWQLVLSAALAILILLSLRFLWVAATYWRKPFRENFRQVLILSWSGMRGLVSLALALAIPTTLSSALPFPQRDLIIFLTIVTILFTLLAQGLTLPLLIRGLKLNKDRAANLRETSEMYQALTKKAIESMDRIIGKEKYSLLAERLVKNYYEGRLQHFNAEFESQEGSAEIGKEATLLLSKILQYERQTLTAMRKTDKISEEIYITILQKLDRDEVGFTSTLPH